MKSKFLVSVLAVGLLAGTSAMARNDKLLLPIDDALRGTGPVAQPRADMQLKFGSATAVSGDALAGGIDAHGVANPTANLGANAGFRTERRADHEVCQDAFRKALGDLQQRARAVGGVAVVGIVSNYRNAVYDSATQYECHIGNTRGVVTLKAQAARQP